MTAKLTNPVLISWYLVVVFLLGSLTTSALTTVPGGEAFVAVTIWVCLVCSLGFVIVALWLWRRARRGLGFGVFTYRPFRVAYAAMALIITLVLFMVTGG